DHGLPRRVRRAGARAARRRRLVPLPRIRPRPGARNLRLAMRAPGIAALVVFTSVPAIAADTAPPVEVFAGYSYTKDGGQGLNGGEASLAIRLTGWIGAEADVSVHYGSALGTRTTRLFFMAGDRKGVG